ncbi:MAG: glycosyltransferase family 4 protein [Candidatus Omnitrophota bacterium]
MKVCHVITKPELGGAQLSTLNIVRGLPKDSFDVSVITSSRGLLSSDYKSLKDVKVHALPLLVRHINPILDIIAFINIWHIYRCYKYNIIHTHSSKAGMIGRWAGFFARVPRIIHTVHGWSFNDHQPKTIRNLYIFLERLTAHVTDKIICVSKTDLETGIKYRIAPRDKFILIKYGIPIEDFRKKIDDLDIKRKEIGIQNQDPIIAMVSCLKPQKSPMDYIEACIDVYSQTKDVNFLLIGDGALRKKCLKKVDEAGLNGRFRFLGWRRDVPELLSIVDMLILTSKWEGLPISLIEGMLKGCLVVATDTGGNSELIKDSITGYLTKPGYPREVSRRIIDSINNPATLKKIREKATLSIDETFNASRMVQDVAELYRRLN